MEKSSFFQSVNHDRVYKAEDWVGYFASFISNGIMPLPSTGLQAVADTGMTVKLLPGKAWIDGYFYHNTDELNLPVDVADGVLSRIDRVVIRKSMTERRMYAAIKKGAPSQKPTAPALQKDADAVELCLADILIGKGFTEIKQVNITDQRLSDLCGISAGVIKQIDTAAFNAQLQAWFTEYQQASAAEYQALTAYMDSLKGQGNTDYAAFTDRMNTLELQTHAEVQELLDSVKALLDGDAVGKIMAEISTLKESPANATATYLDGVVAITTNPGNAKDIYFYAPSDFREADIYTLNGQPLEIKDLNGESIYDAWKAGSPVSIIVKGGIGYTVSHDREEIKRILLSGFADGKKTFSEDGTTITTTAADGRKLEKIFTNSFATLTTTLKSSTGKNVAQSVKNFAPDGKTIDTAVKYFD